MQTALLDPPLSGSERDIILGFIDFQQRVFLRKLEDKNGNLLPEEQLTKQLPPSSMTLKGMASHLWFVEDYWREKILLGRELPEPWLSADWDADRDTDWHSDKPIHEIVAALRESMAKTHAALAAADWDALSAGETRAGERFAGRWIAVHLVEEWGRHLGHADLLREHIDGTVGD